MTTESRPAALRSRFVGGALEAAAHILGSASAGVFVVGLVGPFIAALDSPRTMGPTEILKIAGVALAFSMSAGGSALVLRGLAHCASHDLLNAQPRPDALDAETGP